MRVRHVYATTLHFFGDEVDFSVNGGLPVCAFEAQRSAWWCAAHRRNDWENPRRTIEQKPSLVVNKASGRRKFEKRLVLDNAALPVFGNVHHC